MVNLRCERFGPFDLEELKEELANLEFEYMMDLAPSKPPTVVRLCECKDEDYEGYHCRVFVGDYEYCVEEGNDAEDIKEMLESMTYETYAEQDLEGIPRFHNWYMALPGKSPYDPTYIAESKIRADAFFHEKEERKKLEEAAAASKAAAAIAAAKPWSETPEAERDVAILFPGQGTQKVGMADKLLESKEAQTMFDMASKVLGYSLVDLCAKGPQEKLDTTLYSQPAIFVCSLAAMEIAKKDAPEMLKKIKTAAGFSLGEYSALVFGGGLSFEDGLKVVKARAEAMDAAAKSAKSGMASIGGIADDKLQQCLDEAATAVGSGKAYIANYMFPEGRTCTGDLKVLETACELCTAAGAKNAKMLNVSGAFHSPYMESAGAALGAVLDASDIKMPTIKVYSNVTGKPYTSAAEIKALLKRQLLEPVRWEQAALDMIKMGHAQYVEPGPGKQLKAMMRRIDQDAWTKTITLEK